MRDRARTGGGKGGRGAYITELYINELPPGLGRWVLGGDRGRWVGSATYPT